MRLTYLDLTTTDPRVNLATEQFVFDKLPRDRAYFMLWQNDNAIIIGKHQNTLAEIDLPYVTEHGIRVVRRLSGGGAVYHDLGNLNFTFIMDSGDTERLNFALFCQPVIQVLKQFGVSAQVNGRNDMTICGQKFSGNAQYVREGRVMHHGTILFDSDLAAVGRALRVDPDKIQAKGVQSVRSRVTNIREHLSCEVTLPQFRRALLEHVCSAAAGAREYVLGPGDQAAVRQFRRERDDTWEWNFGQSPPCTLMRRARVEGCGLVEIYLLVMHGKIAQMSFRGDFFSAEGPEGLERYFLGRRPEREEYRQALEGVQVSRYFNGLDNERFLKILCDG